MRRFAVALTAIALAASVLAGCAAGSDQPDNLTAIQDIQQHRGGREVTVQGTVAQVMRPSKNANGRHERFVLDVSTGGGDQQLILVLHNIDIAPEVPLQEGDEVIVHGDLELDRTGPIIHWTHHDPSGRHPAGFIKVHGQTYE